MLNDPRLGQGIDGNAGYAHLGEPPEEYENPRCVILARQNLRRETVRQNHDLHGLVFGLTLTAQIGGNERAQCKLRIVGRHAVALKLVLVHVGIVLPHIEPRYALLKPLHPVPRVRRAVRHDQVPVVKRLHRQCSDLAGRPVAKVPLPKLADQAPGVPIDLAQVLAENARVVVGPGLLERADPLVLCGRPGLVPAGGRLGVDDSEVRSLRLFLTNPARKHQLLIETERRRRHLHRVDVARNKLARLPP